MTAIEAIRAEIALAKKQMERAATAHVSHAHDTAVGRESGLRWALEVIEAASEPSR